MLDPEIVVTNAEEKNVDIDDDDGLLYDYQIEKFKNRVIYTARGRFVQDFDIRHEHFMKQCLHAHNNYRSLHEVPPLKFSKKLCFKSFQRARYLLAIGRYQSPNSAEFGENLYVVWPTNPCYILKGNEPVDFWYHTFRKYVFGTEPNNLLCQHFTQIVWKETTHLGVGIELGDDGKILIVATYHPPGNQLGSFKTQVIQRSGVGVAEEAAKDSQKASSQLFSDKQEEALFLHNELRQRHGAPQLTLDSFLIRSAIDWARRLTEEDRVAYRIENSLGENIFLFETKNPSIRGQIGVRSAIAAWYNEIDKYEFGTEPTDNKARNFTQMVWRNTRRMGMALAHGHRGGVLVVVTYYPRGNIVGCYADNVHAPIGGPLRMSSLENTFAQQHETSEAAPHPSSVSQRSVIKGNRNKTTVDEINVTNKKVSGDQAELIW